MIPSSPVKSRPVYLPFGISPNVRFSLILTDKPTLDPSCLRPETDPDTFDEVWVVHGGSTILPQQHNGLRSFRSVSQLTETLAGRLAHEQMGLRLYAAGSEDFIWKTARIAEQAGLSRDEYSLFKLGPLTRTVMCAHCHTLTRNISMTLITCDGCGATLEVRDHFSRLHGAYLGVQADAETPGILPTVEALT